MYTLYCRIYQFIMRIASLFLPWREPKLLEGEGALRKLPQLLKQKNFNTVLIVTDKGIVSAGLLEGLLKDLMSEEIKFFVYDKTVPNPTLENIREATSMYKEGNCNAIIAIGGGSSIDCAKMAGAQIARPNKDITKMRGVLKVLRKIPPLVAVPTTAGTGAEGTLAAVFTNTKTNEKNPIMDPSLIPQYAVLDPLLTLKLPPHITAATGMDALTHAIEAYIGKSNTEKTKQWSIAAIKLIFENLYDAYSNGDNISARSNMQKAAYYAGLSFTRAYVGYVHAIAHTLGGFYNTPHGLANAIILPYVLEYYGSSIHTELAELADLVNLSKEGETNEEKAQKFIKAIKDLNEKMNIPKKVSGIVDSDIPIMVKRALKEGNPLYPVPKILLKDDIEKIFAQIK